MWIYSLVILISVVTLSMIWWYPIGDDDELPDIISLCMFRRLKISSESILSRICGMVDRLPFGHGPTRHLLRLHAEDITRKLYQHEPLALKDIEFIMRVKKSPDFVHWVLFSDGSS